MSGALPSLHQLEAWLRLRELRLRALHAKLEVTRRDRDRSVEACQRQRAEMDALNAQRRAVHAWCTGPGAAIGPAGRALTLAHDRLLADQLERAARLALDLERQRQRGEQALVQARAHWLQALRQQQATRRWLADWQRRAALHAVQAAESEVGEAHPAAWSEGGQPGGDRPW